MPTSQVGEQWLCVVESPRLIHRGLELVLIFKGGDGSPCPVQHSAMCCHDLLSAPTLWGRRQIVLHFYVNLPLWPSSSNPIQCAKLISGTSWSNSISEMSGEEKPPISQGSKQFQNAKIFQPAFSVSCQGSMCELGNFFAISHKSGEIRLSRASINPHIKARLDFSVRQWDHSIFGEGEWQTFKWLSWM